VKASVLSKDTTENVVTFDLKFENADKISKGTVQDKLVVKVISDVQSRKKGILIHLPYETEVSALIPPQISPSNNIMLIINSFCFFGFKILKGCKHSDLSCAGSNLSNEYGTVSFMRNNTSIKVNVYSVRMGSPERYVFLDDTNYDLSVGAWDSKDYPIDSDEFRLLRPYVDRKVADSIDISSRV
jgi:hypothetical protein